MRKVTAAAICTAIALSAIAVSAEGPISKPGEYQGYSPALYDGYQLTSQYIAVRDGTKLAIDIYRPTLNGVVVTRRLPVVWSNTPYGRRSANSGSAALAIAKYGYVVVIADMRGDYASFGKAVAEPGASSPGNRNEWMPWTYWDAYDVTEWLAAQPWSDGNIGMMGCSAVGHTQWQAAATAPPHLKAIFPMDAPSEYYDWGGITQMLDEPPPVPGPIGKIPAQDAKAVPVDEDHDGSLLQAAKESHRDDLETGYIPFRDSTASGLRAVGLKDYKYHLEVSTFSHFADINRSGIPALETTNYGEDERVKLGVMVKLHNVKTPLKLVVGPGNHCNWTTDDRPNPSNSFNITAEQVRWFDYWLKGVKNGIMDEPPIYFYTYNEPADEAWRHAWQWPLPTQKSVNYYFGPESIDAPKSGVNSGSLETATPLGRDAKDLYTVDYAVTPSNENQRAMTYTTPPLAADTMATGHPVIHLWISSTATDDDFLAFLADVAPDGTVTRLPGTEDGKLRASHRTLNAAPYDNLGLPYHRSFAEDVKPLEPGRPTELVFDMAPLSWVFKAGHRIRLIISCVEIPRHAGAAPPTRILSPPPVVTFYRETAHASYIQMPLHAPVETTVKITRSATGNGTTAYIGFPKILDRRYLKDIKQGSVQWNGTAAARTRLEGDTLVAEFDGAAKAGNSVTIHGQFGDKYFYGEFMGFRGTGHVSP
jgi:putative CocE/NonD family hydrolase